MAGTRELRKVVSGGLASWQVALAQRLLLNDLRADQSVQQIAAHCGLSRSYFEKAFKASLGTPPHQWLVQHRIRRAAKMLEQTDGSISAIAISCGFTDQSHFTRVFRTMVGFSPAAWRRQRKAGLAPPLPAIASRFSRMPGPPPG